MAHTHETPASDDAALPRPIHPSASAPPGGHYSPGVVHGCVVHVSGQLPVRPDGSRANDAPFEEQARVALDNLLAVVEAAGGSASTLLKVQVYVVGIEHWPAFNAVYAERMGDARPARAVIPVPELHHGFLVEIDGVAAVTGAQGPG